MAGGGGQLNYLPKAVFFCSKKKGERKEKENIRYVRESERERKMGREEGRENR